MKSELETIFESSPEDAPRSRLEPYRDLILRWRRQGRTYRRIRTLLSDQCSVQTSTTMLFKFVKARSRPRKIEREPETPPVLLRVSGQTADDQPGTSTHKPRRTLAEREALLEAARASNFKPLITVERETRPIFDFDETKPLSNRPHSKEK